MTPIDFEIPSPNVGLVAEQLEWVMAPKECTNAQEEAIVAAYEEAKGVKLFSNEFVAVSTNPLSYVAEAPKGLLRANDLPKATFWFRNNFLCPIYTLTLSWESHVKNKQVSVFAHIPVGSSECEALLGGKTDIFLVRKGKCVEALTLKVCDLGPHFWALLPNTDPEVNIGDAKAAKVWVTTGLDQNPSPERELQASWADRLHREVFIVFQSCMEPDYKASFQAEIELLARTTFAQYFFSGADILAKLYWAFQEAFSQDYDGITASITSAAKELGEAPFHRDLIVSIMRCAWFSSDRTDCGLSFYSLEPNNVFQKVTIDSAVLAKKAGVFWDRIPFEPPLYFNLLFGGGSVPMEPEVLMQALPTYEGEVEEGWQVVSDLLDEANALKQSTIPSGAYVQLEIGEIKATKLYEMGQNVTCVLVNQAGEFFQVWIDTRTKELSFALDFEFESILHASPSTGIMQNQSGELFDEQNKKARVKDIFDRIRLAIVIPIVAMIRDFWVVEERTTVFGASRLTKKSPRLNSDRGKSNIVYLPRVRYVRDITGLTEPLRLETRRAHFVTGHLRKAVEASPVQIMIAKKYGISVPEGFTFVKPYKKGGKAKQKIYRSRSALQCLRSLKPVNNNNEVDDWFAFEENTASWLNEMGYVVEHLAGSRNGDRGVDIQAHKGSEVLLVQCKYWRTKKVGPDVIRELVGTVQGFPEGAKGVLISSTELTSGAQKLAQNMGIEYIQNVDFQKPLDNRL